MYYANQPGKVSLKNIHTYKNTSLEHFGCWKRGFFGDYAGLAAYKVSVEKSVMPNK